MGFKQTIADMCPKGIIPCEYAFTAFGDGWLYVEGVRCVKSFTREEILFGFKKSCLKITGRYLRIEKICDGDAVVCGRISCIERIPL